VAKQLSLIRVPAGELFLSRSQTLKEGICMSETPMPKKPFLTLLLSIAWFIGLIVAAALVAYIPGALKYVDDERLGRAMARIMVPASLPLIGAAIQFARRKYVSAVILSGLVFLLIAYLDFHIIKFAVQHP
jgi:hypothetical protein